MLISKENENNSNKHQKIELRTHITSLSVHTEVVFCLTLLYDGRLVSGSYDCSIIIYNKETYQTNIIIKEHKDAVRNLIQLKNKILASCSLDKTIKLFNIKETQYEIIQTIDLHSDWVMKILELSNNYFVSGSKDKKIIFYINEGKKYKKNYSISTSEGVRNIIETKQNEIVYSTWDDKINFFDLNERKNKLVIENISTSIYSFYMISKDLLLIIGEKINIININEYKKIRQIDIPNANWINGVCRLNNNEIITGDNSNTLREWKIEKDNLILISKKENAHNGFINVILNLGNEHFVTASDDKTIKIW